MWSFVLEERGGGTRLISRNRFRLPTLGARLGMLPLEPASLVMERKMLRGIRARAERLAAADQARPRATQARTRTTPSAGNRWRRRSRRRSRRGSSRPAT